MLINSHIRFIFLFLNWDQIEIEYSISFYHAGLLFQENYLSFNPEEKKELYNFELAELIFLKTLFFDSGLSKEHIYLILKGLDKPYRYSFNDIYWDLQDNSWKSFIDKSEQYVNENYRTIIEEDFEVYVDDCEDIDYLESMIEHIDFRVQSLRENDEQA
jgi:hypothetical protein